MADEIETKYASPPDNFPHKGGSGSGTDIGYTVEARLAYSEARDIAGQIFDTRWKQVNFQQITPPFGVPARASMATQHGMMGYAQAQALRWWFIAVAETDYSSLCLETRLIQHRVGYSYTITAESAHAVIGGEDRSSIMPDWGKKAEAS